MRIANQGIKDNRRRILELEEFRSEAEPVIELGKSIIKVAMGNVELKVGNTSLLKDKVTLADFGGELKE